MPTLAEAARHLKPRHRARRLPPLILMTDSIRLPDPDASILALAPGSAVVLRERCRARLATLARRISPLCRARRIRLLVAGDWRLAHEVGAGGLHLPEAAIRHGPSRWRRSAPPRLDRHRRGAFSLGYSAGGTARRGCRPAFAGFRHGEPSLREDDRPPAFRPMGARESASRLRARRHRRGPRASPSRQRRRRLRRHRRTDAPVSRSRRPRPNSRKPE